MNDATTGKPTANKPTANKPVKPLTLRQRNTIAAKILRGEPLTAEELQALQEQQQQPAKPKRPAADCRGWFERQKKIR